MLHHLPIEVLVRILLVSYLVVSIPFLTRYVILYLIRLPILYIRCCEQMSYSS